MNPEIKAKWVAALRSGEYRQGQSALSFDDGTFCCLGVLCDLAVKDEVIRPPKLMEDYPNRFVFEGNNWGSLPLGVIRWAGLEGSDPEVMIERQDEDGTWTSTENLSALNDDGKPFAEIADLIEHSLAQELRAADEAEIEAEEAHP